MMREAVTSLDPTWGELVDVDVLDSGHWAGLFAADGRLFIRTIDTRIPVPATPQYPLIRCLDQHRVVVANRFPQGGQANAWVLCMTDARPHAFFAGYGIQDVLAANDTIVVTYSDEGVFRGPEPGDQGIAVFSAAGALRTGYRSLFGTNGVDIADCYAACWERDSRIAFFPYTGFQLVTWDLLTGEQTVSPTPRCVHGSSAIALSGDATMFFGPYDEKHAIIEWSPRREPSVIGSHPGPLRGLRGGRFLAHDTSGFAIVERAAQQGVAADGASPRR